MTLSEKVGQLLCAGWHGCLQSDTQATLCVEELHAGGMIVMGRNVRRAGETVIDAAGVRAMLDHLQSRAKTPLLIPTDQEGGRVARLGTVPFTRLPPASEIGDEKSAFDAAHTQGRELSLVGINANFAPVADVHSNPKNPVIGDRSFGADPAHVAQMVSAQVKGYLKSGVLPCVKHFPGHGDTSVDSHFALPALPHPLGLMERRELVPFRAGISAGCPMVMTAHILFPALDPDLPATLSPAILTGLLRETLGFQGVIVTDCLEMNAIAERWGVARAAVLSVKAGADMVLICHTYERQKEAFDALKSAVESGELPESRLNDALARIQKLKAGITPAPPFDVALLGGTDAGEIATLGESAPV